MKNKLKQNIINILKKYINKLNFFKWDEFHVNLPKLDRIRWECEWVSKKKTSSLLSQMFPIFSENKGRESQTHIPPCPFVLPTLYIDIYMYVCIF